MLYSCIGLCIVYYDYIELLRMSAVGSQTVHALAGDVGVVVAVRELEKTPLVPLYCGAAHRIRACRQTTATRVRIPPGIIGVLQFTAQFAGIEQLQPLSLGAPDMSQRRVLLRQNGIQRLGGGRLDCLGPVALRQRGSLRDGGAANRIRACRQTTATRVRIAPGIVGVLQFARELPGVEQHLLVSLQRQHLVEWPKDLRR